MRYTEARLEALADEMMADLDKETVDFVPNYDETTEEPTVLPAPFPNLLVNGSTGIAVGMATNIPPHNLREVIDAAIWTIESAQSDEPPTLPEKQRKLLELVPGPDFPTGGYIVGRQGIQQAYLTGRGAVIMRAKAEIEVNKKGDRSVDRHRRDSVPGQQGAADRAHRRAGAREDDRRHLRHPRRVRSRRHAHRHRPEARRGRRRHPEQPLQAHALQTSFGIIMLAIVGGRPKVLSLVELIDNFVEFRREVVRRRTEFELRKAEARAPHPRRPEDRARSPRRGDRADPRRRRTRPRRATA